MKYFNLNLKGNSNRTIASVKKHHKAKLRKQTVNMVKILGVISEQWGSAERTHRTQERTEKKDKNVS